MEANFLEADGTVCSHKRRRRGTIDQGVRPRDCPHALLHGAHILEDADRLPHDPARHTGNAVGEARGESDRAERHRAVHPEPHGKAARAHDEDAVQDGHRSVHQGDQPRFPLDGGRVLDERGASIVVLALRMSEELHGLDVGVAVHDAAGEAGP